ncbi:hypothetical protein [Domibacillus aminovorans]|uniref:Uncharacterized protein n=1 Tax=Domibacillus aminovorans TaxID=29332 RepID=A0A177L069_9BACI|nr:hypothetical protein [Domibacillus aminovorans]OAH59038.1 hypothetical protein AWH49_05085 [Domibacillus aminovorans]
MTTGQEGSRQWTLPKTLIDTMAGSAKPLELQTFEGHRVTLPKEVIVQLQKGGQESVTVKMNVLDKKEASLSPGLVYSDILDVTMKADAYEENGGINNKNRPRRSLRLFLS